MKQKIDVTGDVVENQNFFKVNLDVLGYEPDEFSITIRGKILCVRGFHEEEVDDQRLNHYHYNMREFCRKFLIPDNVDTNKMKSFLYVDRRSLSVEAPLKDVEEIGEPKGNTFKGRKAD